MLDRSVGFRCLILSLVLISPAVLWAADTEGREPGAALARLDLQPARVDWQPKAGDQRLVLTVSGPDGFYLQRELGPGQAPFLSALDLPEARLADGTYAYELRAVARLDAPAEPLVHHFVERFNRDLGRGVQVVPPAVLRDLVDAPGPATCASSRTWSSGLMVLSPGRELAAPADPALRAQTPRALALPAPELEPVQTLEEVERDHIRRVLHQVNGNQPRPPGCWQ